jgi:hypothetical protein
MITIKLTEDDRKRFPTRMGGGRRLFGFECKVIVFMGAEAGVLIFMAIHEGREVGSTSVKYQ